MSIPTSPPAGFGAAGDEPTPPRPLLPTQRLALIPVPKTVPEPAAVSREVDLVTQFQSKKRNRRKAVSADGFGGRKPGPAPSGPKVTDSDRAMMMWLAGVTYATTTQLLVKFGEPDQLTTGAAIRWRMNRMVKRGLVREEQPDGNNRPKVWLLTVAGFRELGLTPKAVSVDVAGLAHHLAVIDVALQFGTGGWQTWTGNELAAAGTVSAVLPVAGSAVGRFPDAVATHESNPTATTTLFEVAVGTGEEFPKDWPSVLAGYVEKSPRTLVIVGKVSGQQVADAFVALKAAGWTVRWVREVVSARQQALARGFVTS